MFKIILIIILGFSTCLFAYIAIRNSSPLECTDVYIVNQQSVCVVNMHQSTDLKAVQELLKRDSYKYTN